MSERTYYEGMKGTSGHIYKSKTMRIAFPSKEEEVRFDSYVAAQGLKKGAFVYRLIKDYLDAEDPHANSSRPRIGG